MPDEQPVTDAVFVVSPLRPPRREGVAAVDAGHPGTRRDSVARVLVLLVPVVELFPDGADRAADVE